MSPGELSAEITDKRLPIVLAQLCNEQLIHEQDGRLILGP
jgi:hypothetical protein